MADLPVPGSFQVKPNVRCERLWYEDQVAELEESIAAWKAEKEKIIRVGTNKIEIEIDRAKRKMHEYTKILDLLEARNDEDIIEIKQITQQ